MNKCIVILYNGMEPNEYVKKGIQNYLQSIDVIDANSDSIIYSYNEDDIANILAGHVISPVCISTPEESAITVVLNSVGNNLTAEQIKQKIIAEIIQSKFNGYDSNMSQAIKVLCKLGTKDINKMIKQKPDAKIILEIVKQLCAGQITISTSLE